MIDPTAQGEIIKGGPSTEAHQTEWVDSSGKILAYQDNTFVRRGDVFLPLDLL
jgi:hypothetical protein